jgi:hypothetical protein
MTWIKHYKCGEDDIQVVIIDEPQMFAWRLCVNGDWSHRFTDYSVVSIHKGYGVATDYYGPDLEEFVPFKIQYASEVK